MKDIKILLNFLQNLIYNPDNTNPNCDFDDLLYKSSGIIVLSGTIRCLIGSLFNKGLFKEVDELLPNFQKYLIIMYRDSKT